jgi:periplasmic protein TonB
VTTRPLLPYSPAIGRAIDARDVFHMLPFSGKGVAFLLSVSAHVALGVALARGAQRTSHVSPPQRVLVEISAVDLALDPPAEPAHSETAVPTPHERQAHPFPPRPPDASARSLLPAPVGGDSSALAAPAVITSVAATAPHFAMTVGATTRPSGDGIPTDSRAAAPGSGAADQPSPEALVDTAAKLLAGSSPSYTAEAEAAGVEADVPLEIVVDALGTVIAARLLARVGYGLDEAALRGVRAYRFSPARRAGKALAVRMRWLMRFQLR